ncbi:glucan endo-1,3-beta-glucosidase isoform X2 [Cryptomeria japonica]|nr:glucan endo-1,3-beta-glucosidase isoform X2 [Cryptomeria japonica]
MIGVCYGMLSDSLPSQNEVVNLLKSNNIGKVRLYDANQGALEALQNSGIEVIVAVGNAEVEKIAGDQAAANGWMNDKITAFYPSVDIKYIAVGNEVFANRAYVSYLLPAMKNIQTALRNANLQNDIKVSTPHAMSVLNSSFPPSQGTFGEDMSSILQFLSDNDSPFMANVYPYFSYKDNPDSISADYALFRSMSTVVNDGSLMYNNLFDAMVDTFISAMEKLGHSNIPIVITETGWPSAGNVVATVDNARTYNNNLIKHVLSNAGTPKRPGRAIDTYIFSLFNENQEVGDEEERHFGLFETNKIPLYTVSSSPESSRGLKVVYIYLTVV